MAAMITKKKVRKIRWNSFMNMLWREGLPSHKTMPPSVGLGLAAAVGWIVQMKERYFQVAFIPFDEGYLKA